MIEQIVNIAGVASFVALAIVLVFFFVVPGVSVFWVLVLKSLGVPRAVQLWKDIEAKWEYPRPLVVVAKESARLKAERDKCAETLRVLPLNSPQREALVNELNGWKVGLSATNDQLARMFILHLERHGEIK